MTTTTATRIRGKQREELAEALRQRVSGEALFDPASRVLYSTDASIYQMEPVGVVIPRSIEDVQAVVEIARDAGVPILPRGGGTSLAGQTVNHAVVIDFSKYLNKVLEVNQEERWARVQPGIVVDHLNQALRQRGLHYTPDPSTTSRCCVGGNIGNNSCGAHSVIYGKTLDHVKELNVILADGKPAHLRPVEGQELEAKLSGQGLESEIYRGVRRIARENLPEILARYPKITRRVSGYNLDEFLSNGPMNLARMVVGSEGTLCVVTEAKVNLMPRPKMVSLAVLHFRDIFEASAATMEVLKHGPSVIEIMDDMLLQRTRESASFSKNLTFIQGDPKGLLLVEFYGESEKELISKMDGLKQDLQRQGLGYAYVNLIKAQDQAAVWNIRKAGLGLLMSIHGDAKPIPFVEDAAVDPTRLGEYVRRFDEIVRAHGTEAGYYGHASEGCLHIRPLISLKDEDGIRKMVSIADEISDLVLEYGGSMSGEHGDGIVRGVWTEKMFGPQVTQAFRDVKKTFDPQGIMNPGKIFDTPPMTENLRYGAQYRAASIPTRLDFSLDSDFAGAVEMCNGMAECRKMTGTMCPSYQATKDEEHSTRGRANLLRAALTGKLDEEGGITGRRLYDALDLCLECKGCKGDCPSGVDMAKLKYEFLANYYQANGTPFRNKVVGNINKLNQWGSRFAPLANLGARSPLGKLVSSKVLGFHPKRQLPPFAGQTFPQWFKSHQPAHPEKLTRGTVALFNDTYTNYNHPEIGKAAVAVLEAAGYRVTLANTRCCGRPMISKGQLESAQANARFNVDLLHAYADQGVYIVGLEPSCLLTFRDEYPEFLKDEKSKKVAQHTLLIDEFLALLQDRGELNLAFNPEVEKKILFHGHCHQKALVGTEPSLRALRLPPGYQVELINSGCCGMAGSFGYEKEHYELSMSIGNLALFPAINGKGADWEVAVMGVSCRHQVEHGTGRKARHLVEFLADALA